MEFLFILILVSPILAALLSAIVPSRRVQETVTLASSAILAASMVWLYQILSADVSERVILNGMFRLDGLGFFFLAIVAFVVFVTTLYTRGYLRVELEHQTVDTKQVRMFYTMYNLFVFAMVFAILCNNLGLLWVGVEATTITSAYLVGIYHNRSNIEAAWKYLVISSVGLTLALAGTVLLYFSAHAISGVEGSLVLQWDVLYGIASKLNPEIVKMAFVFLLVGYGTKMGLAPMHTWLPDAHGNAPTPISALLSGVLLNVALYGLLRTKMIADVVVGPEFTGTLMLVLGFLSVGIAAFAMLRQDHLKRLLAYSSVEHMGLIVIGFALNTPLAVFATLFHVLNHSLAKSFSFFAAGNLLLTYRTDRISNVTNLMKHTPVLAWTMMMAAMIMTGFPPFNIFLSKITLLIAAADVHPWIMWVLVALLTLVFAGFLWNVMRLLRKSEEDTIAATVAHVERLPAWNYIALIIHGVAIVGLGVALPVWLYRDLMQLAQWISL